MADHAGSSAAQMSKNKMKQLIWPDPLVVQSTGIHTHSIILLHGRGSNAERFGLELLKARTSDNHNSKTLAEHFPGLKFIFPTAKKRRAVIFNRTPINQWFDNHSLEEPLQRQELQYDGLRETSAFVHHLITQEAKLVGVERVVIGGLSQGCAAALHVLLNFQPESGALLGFVGMCGWLPFATTFVDDGDELGEDVFSAASEEPVDPMAGMLRLQLSAANTARDIASLPALELEPNGSPAFLQTPVFLGHGTHDEKVVIKLGEQARDVLLLLGCNVEWKEYDEGHWYKVPEQIDDLVVWLKTRI
ncbi:Abhydrolase-2 domain-containing protein [Mycena venus]|uniref:Abhydrolase-2 domain-containing protein n=1 Tax=Mycena venus TaxID=2733690 RepID=A0A8H6YR55_9AGAR|nr:Abhydrolase-2 domain-containing protein [Mycena venus]